jgi:hypothetical protein
MDSVKLMDRVDTKFTFALAQLPLILGEASRYYRILTIQDHRMFHYDNLYFDTPGLAMYLAHHDGKLNRQKVRIRKYAESGSCFLEIKMKSNKGRTSKKRIPVSDMELEPGKESGKFIERLTPYRAVTLEPKLWIRFARITLVHHTVPERLTIDTELNFEKEGKQLDLPHLVISEAKLGGATERSDFVSILKQHMIYPSGMSKYCIGTALMNPDVKYNRFKSKLLSLQKL